MLKVHKERIVEQLRKSDLSPADITFDEKGNITKVRYRDSGMYFQITQDTQRYHAFTVVYTTFSPKFPTYAKGQKLTIDDVTKAMENWINSELKAYRIEDEHYDPFALWAGLTVDFDNADPFTPDEILFIQNKLQEASSYIEKDTELRPEDITELTSAIRFLANEVKTAKQRIQWKQLAITTFVTTIANLSVDVDKQEKLWALIVGVFQESAPQLIEFVQTFMLNAP